MKCPEEIKRRKIYLWGEKRGNFQGRKKEDQNQSQRGKKETLHEFKSRGGFSEGSV